MGNLLRFSVLLCLGILIPFSPVISQYIPLLDNTQWYSNEDTPLSSAFDWYELGRDTVIKGETYRLGLRNGQPEGVWIREDAPNRQVWIAAAWDGYTERILYDFGLAVGDTIVLDYRAAGSQRYLVDQIDAVNTTQGFQDRWNLMALDGGGLPLVQWVVGVGGLTHPFYLDASLASDTTYRLSCNYINGVKLYDDGFGTCPNSPPPLGLAEGDGLGRRMGQTGNYLWVDLPPGPKGTVRFYGLHGRLLLADEVGPGQHRWEAQELPQKTMIVVLDSPKTRIRKLISF